MKINLQKYGWVYQVANPPKMIAEALKIGLLNTNEILGVKSNSEIMKLAAEAGVANIYKSDEMAWCAVSMTAIALRAGKIVPFTGYDRLRAKSFEKFGTKVIGAPMFGDVLVFNRAGGFHVGQYFAEDETCFHVGGGNQGNQFNIVRIEKARLYAARRPSYSVGVPPSVKRYFVDAKGEPSKNEA